MQTPIRLASGYAGLLSQLAIADGPTAQLQKLPHWWAVWHRVRGVLGTFASPICPPRILPQMGHWPWFAGVEAQHGTDRDHVFMVGGNGGRSGGTDPENSPTETLSFYHDPILVEEIMDFLKPMEGKRVLDVTLGGGGHSEQFLMRGANVVGVDQDPTAIAHASSRLRAFAHRFCALRGNFRDFPEILSEIGVEKFDGILADLGVSSRQLDDPEKGFSFQQDGPLDLRMNPDAVLSASDIINNWTAEDLHRILIDYGEEPHARRIVRAIIERRAQGAITTTLQLANLIASVSPRKGHRHPATLTFQALRIAVNDELGALEDLLETAPAWLKPGGRLAIISFHSLEDRIVKRALQRFAAKELDRPEWPAPRPNPSYCMEIITRKPVEASPAEIKRNPRSRSARLRVAQVINQPEKGEQQP